MRGKERESGQNGQKERNSNVQILSACMYSNALQKKTKKTCEREDRKVETKVDRRWSGRVDRCGLSCLDQRQVIQLCRIHRQPRKRGFENVVLSHI